MNRAGDEGSSTARAERNVAGIRTKRAETVDDGNRTSSSIAAPNLIVSAKNSPYADKFPDVPEYSFFDAYGGRHKFVLKDGIAHVDDMPIMRPDGVLTRTMDLDEIPHGNVSGFKVFGGKAEQLSAQQLEAMAQKLNAPVLRMSRDEIARNFGDDAAKTFGFVDDSAGKGNRWWTVIPEDVTGKAYGDVLGHEVVGHVVPARLEIDKKYVRKPYPRARSIFTDASYREAQRNYHAIHEGEFFQSDGSGRLTSLVTPQTHTYKGKSVGHEYLADSGMLAARYPGFLHATAPQTAKMLRQRINQDSEMRKIYISNSFAPFAIGVGLGAAAYGAGAGSNEF